MKKNFLFLTAIMLLGIVSTFAQGGTTGSLTWILEDGTLTISGEGTMPDYYYTYEVPWWDYQESIYTVIIENGVTSIGRAAFYGDPNSYYSHLSSVTIPNSVARIGDYAFTFCRSLVSITIPDGVTKIGNYAFCECRSLLSITIPNSVTSIGECAFNICTSLTSIIIPDNVTSIKPLTFGLCINLSSVTIPYGVTNIGEAAFWACASLTSIIIPNSVTNIGNGAFYECYGLTTITIPGSVTRIENNPFEYCENLTAIDVESGNNSYVSENGILFDISKTTLICYPTGKTEASYIIPNSVTIIGTHAFSACESLTSITITDNVTWIKDRAFPFCESLTTITIPNSVKWIGEEAFIRCTGLTSITIPNSVISIGKGAFYECTSLSSITIPNSIRWIESWTFGYCSNLTSITISASVKNIGYAAFAYCWKLTSITNLNPMPVTIDYNSDVFYGVNQSACMLKVPTSAVVTYQNADVWNKFNIIGGGILVNPIVSNSKYGYTMGNGLYEENDQVAVMAVANNGYEFVNWTKDGTEISTNIMYIFTVTEDVELVANFEEEVGIDEWKIENGELKIYPNPTDGQLQITNYELRIENIEIFDVFGRLCHVETHGRASLQQPTTTINISHLPAGIYFVRIQTENGAVTRKVVKI